MPEVIVGDSAVVQAPAEAVYAVFADYHEGHPSVLPRPPFGRLVVEQGGAGAGTVFTVQTRQGLAMRTFRMRVTEPQPGRLLMESDVDSDLTSTFEVEPVDGGRGARVTITTRWTRGGVQGFVERLLLPRLARPIYAKEIRNAERVARERIAARSA